MRILLFSLFTLLLFLDLNGQDMVYIKGGSFMMGQADGEGDERPVHKVTLDDFYMAAYEVTVKEYREFCDATEREMPEEPDWGWQDNHPISNTSWYDAKAFIDWLNEKTEKHYRLPTEAEFEYVIRNGGKTKEQYSIKSASINENVADESFKRTSGRTRIWEGYDDGFAYLSPVGSFPPNALGIYDINGNAWEWCSDWYGEYPKEAVINPKGPNTGSHKVGRGASYGADPWHCRAAGRNWGGALL